MTDSCKDCKFWFSSGLRKEREVGTCRIRSTPGGFPPRYSDEWCGEFVSLEIKAAKSDDGEQAKSFGVSTVVRKKKVASELPPTVVDVPNG